MIALLALAGCTMAAPVLVKEGTVTIPAAGHEWFSYILGFPGWAGGAPSFLPTVDDALREPAAAMIFCLGPADLLENRDLEGFVRAGGALVIATERIPPESVNNALAAMLGATPTGIEGRSASPQTQGFAYGGQEACPLAKGKAGHPWFFGQGKEVRPATNRPTVLRSLRKGMEAASFAGPVHLDSPLKSDLLAVSAIVGDGRAGLIGDTGILSNLMLQAPDNIPFALNLVEWAREGNNKPRSRVLLIVDGEVVPNPFVPPLIMPPLPMPNPGDLIDNLYKGAEGLVQGFEKGLADLEDRDALNRMTGGITPRNWIYFLGALGAVAMAGILIRFLAGATAKTRFADVPKIQMPAPKRFDVWRSAGDFIRRSLSRWRNPTRQENAHESH